MRFTAEILLRLRMCGTKGRLPDDSNLSDAAFDLETDIHIGLAIKVVLVIVTAVFKARDVDVSDTPMRFGANADVFRDADSRLPHPSRKVYVVVVRGFAAKVEIDLAGTHLHGDMVQVQIAHLEPALARATIQRKIEKNLVA